MKIGYYFSAKKSHGGVYQYTSTFLEALVKNPDNHIVIFTQSPDIPEDIVKRKNVSVIRSFGDVKQSKPKKKETTCVVQKDKIVERLITVTTDLLLLLRQFGLVSEIEKFLLRGLVKKIDSEKLNLMIFPTSSNLSLHIKPKIIVAIHDLQHRLNPRFPEVSSGSRWLSREYLYSRLCKKAKMILTESEVGRDDVIKFYKVSRKRIMILPYLPPTYLKSNLSHKQSQKIIGKLGIRNEYLFYPANYWPHKNHLTMLQALKEYNKTTASKLSLVLTGTSNVEFSTLPQINAYIKKNNMSKYVRQLGYVSSMELSALYKNSLAMVMPTYFGPTNIPVLEAWKMKTPVIYSDIRGCRDQLGKAGILINPASSSDIANKIRSLSTDNKIRNILVRRGVKRLQRWTIIDSKKRIDDLINSFARI